MAWTLEGGRLVAGNSMQVGFEWAESGTYKGLRVNPKYSKRSEKYRS